MHVCDMHRYDVLAWRGYKCSDCGRVYPSGHQPTHVHNLSNVRPYVRLGEGTVIWQYADIQTHIGKHCVVGHCSQVLAGATVGDYCRIQGFSIISENVDLVGDNFIGAHVSFASDKYPKARSLGGGRDSYDWKGEMRTIVEQGASIGSGVTLLGGIRIGTGAMVGAGAVVTKDVEPGTTVYGNPARTKGTREEGRTITDMFMEASEDRLKAMGWPNWVLDVGGEHADV